LRRLRGEAEGKGSDCEYSRGTTKGWKRHGGSPPDQILKSTPTVRKPMPYPARAVSASFGLTQ
jgi:hypothetical protein